MSKQTSAVQQLNRRFFSSLLVISLIIGLIEILVMVLLTLYQEKTGVTLTGFQENTIDAFLLVLLGAPLLWLVVLRPLLVQIAKEQLTVAEHARLNAELRAALNTHALVSITDRQGRIVYANDQFCQVSAYSLEELLGQDHRIVNSGYHGKEYIRSLWETISQGRIWQGVFCNRNKNGHLYWVDSTITPLLDETGTPYQYISIRRDITAQKAADSELAIFKQAVDACSEMIFITNSQGYIHYANPALYQMTGWTEATLLGRPSVLLDGPNADKQVLASMQASLRRNESWSGRLLNYRRGPVPPSSAGQTLPSDTQEFWVEMYITPIVNEHSELSGYVQIQRDISAQVAKEMLEQMEHDDTNARLAISNILQQALPLKERFIQILDSLFNLKSIYLQHKGGIFLRADGDDGLDMFVLQGSFSDEFIEKEQHIACGSCLCGRAALSGEILVSDDCFCDPRHEHTFANMQAHGHYIVPIISAGEALGVLFLYTDPYPSQNDSRLSMLKQVGEMLALAILQEQAKVSLENARDMATQAALAKSEFLANMSHEIRTPMNGVLGMLDLLRDTNMSRSQWDLVETAHSSAEALLAILNDILDFSKLEAGKVEVEQIDFNLATLIEDVCSLLAARAHSKDLELNCFMPVAMPRCWKGDPTRIRQVLTNLLGNAIKFTEHGEVSVTVKHTPSNEGPNHFRFEVRDTGVGIAPEAQAHLFQPFSQAETNTARRFGGTGLGLSISKTLVELMGGTVGLESAPGLGACFWFTLPLTLSESKVIEVPLLDITGKRVLVVDDNATNRTILQHYLIHWGFTVGQVDSGRAALIELEDAIANGEPYDLALLDMHMPEMDGLTVARIITETPALARIPRILLSSGGLLGDSERQALGFTQSLLKPVRQSQLFDAIANALYSFVRVAPEKAKTETPVPSYQGKKLLVVEDNKVNQKVITGILAKFQLVPDIADNGQLALDKLAQSTYDLILMDCQMPVLDGYQAVRELRRREMEQGSPRQAVVALTAHAAMGEREKCLAAGMDDYLTKPVTWVSLAEILARWLGILGSETEQLPALERGVADVAWDKTAALKGLGGDEELLGDMIISFLTEMPKQLSAIQIAQERDELPALADAAHAIKGAVSYFYAVGVRDYAVRLEQAARSKQSADYRQMAEVLVNAVAQLMETLRQFMDKNPS
jgi:PAS domain S-box-containing protein